MHPQASHRTRALRAALLAGVSALAAACAGDQDPAPVDYKGTQPAVTAPEPAPAAFSEPTPDANGVIVYDDYAMAIARSGDTLDAIAARTGAAAGDIAAYNGLPAGYRPRAGDELVLPPKIGGYASAAAAPAALSAAASPLSEPAPLSQPAPADAWSEARIAEAISRGETPPSAAAPASSAVATPGGARDIVYHEVTEDETLFSVARRYGVPVETLAQWNAISGPGYSVTAGQVLTVPVENAAQVTGTGANLVQIPGATVAPVPPSASAPLPRDTLAVAPLASPQLDQYQDSTRGPIDPPPPAPLAAPEPVTQIPTAAAQDAAAADGGRFTPPVPGPIVIPYNRVAGPKQNDGVDFGASPGDPVTAAGDGTVALVSSSLGDWGSIVLIRHGSEYMTVYGRLGTVAVVKGQEVKRGDTVGAVAAPNDGGRAMMHFEVRRGAFSEDPTAFF